MLARVHPGPRRLSLSARTVISKPSLVRVRRASAPDATTRVTEDTSNRLRSLGYVGATSPQPATGRDPKSAVALINRIERAIADVRRDPTRASEELRAVVVEDPEIVIA